MVAKQLASDFFVLAPDLRNHGHSPHLAEHGYPAMAADILQVLDRFGLPEAALVGHSMGGKVAMQLALTQGHRVSRLVVVDMAPVEYQHDFASVLEALESIDLDTVTSRKDADAQMRGRVTGASVRAFLLQNLVREEGTWRWRLNLPALAAAQAAITGFPTQAPDVCYRGPTCFVHGELSDYVRPSYVPEIRRLFPLSQLTRIEGAGHWVYADQPELFMRTLRDCLGGPSDSPR
jgi:pimeloyl-ACP methyl ester carboxylesterase